MLPCGERKYFFRTLNANSTGVFECEYSPQPDSLLSDIDIIICRRSTHTGVYRYSKQIQKKKKKKTRFDPGRNRLDRTFATANYVRCWG
jgi:hypothetical protein